MGYDVNLRKQIQERDIDERVHQRLTKTLLTEEFENFEDILKDVFVVVIDHEKQIKICVKRARQAVGELQVAIKAVINNSPDRNIIKFLSEDMIMKKDAPNELIESLKYQGTFRNHAGDLMKTIDKYMEEILVAVQWCDYRESRINVCDTYIKKVWSHLCDHGELPQIEIDLEFKDEMAEALHKHFYGEDQEDLSGDPDSDKKGGGKNPTPKEDSPKSGEDNEQGTEQAPPPENQSYAQKAKANETPKKTKVAWADMSSDEERLPESLVAMFSSFTKSKSQKPFIQVPKDFKDLFPDVHARWVRLCEKWKWDLHTVDAASMLGEGFIGQDYEVKNEKAKEDILSALKQDQRVALRNFLTIISAVTYRADSLLSDDVGGLVTGYIFSLFLKHKYKDSDSDMKLLQASLKGSDGGRDLLKGRMYECFSTGSSCANIFFESFEKIMRKHVTQCGDYDRDEIIANAHTCQTTLHGVINNCLHNVTKTEWTTKEEKLGRNKLTKTRVQKKRTGKDYPKLTASKLELKNSEIEKIRSAESSFNKLEELTKSVVEHFEHSDDPLATPKIANYMVETAYAKLSIIRRVCKSRRDAIRARADEIDPDQRTNNAHWTKARSEMLKEFEDLDDDILLPLNWNKKQAIRDVENILTNP
jgi:hypothetical protein